MKNKGKDAVHAGYQTSKAPQFTTNTTSTLQSLDRIERAARGL
jgi:hypothetical protein